MATIYKVEIVSHWTNYTKEQLQKILEDAVKQKERDKGNTMTIEVNDMNEEYTNVVTFGKEPNPDEITIIQEGKVVDYKPLKIWFVNVIRTFGKNYNNKKER